MKATYFPGQGETERAWWVADADGQVLGRLAARIAETLRGKHKTVYTPFIDTGDFVVVVNAEKVRLTGRKTAQKVYHDYSGYPGGMKDTTAAERLVKDPTRVIREAVGGMLPHNRHGRALLRKLKVYAGPEHPHTAQSPQPLAPRRGGASGESVE